MKRIKTYDLPTRFFHWVFAISFIAAFLIAENVDDESVIFTYHMFLGLTMALAVLLRIIWGFVGSRYARFSSFDLKPSNLVEYGKSVLTSKSIRQMGHNPASSWAALAMMTFTLGLVTTGLLMSQDIYKDFFEEVHELLGKAFLITAIAHIAGVILHSIKHRDKIGLSMVLGTKEPVEGEPAIQKSHAGVAIAFLIAIGLFVFHLNQNYNPETGNLNIFGYSLHLGEHEHEHKGGEKGSESDDHQEDEEHDKHQDQEEHDEHEEHNS